MKRLSAKIALAVLIIIALGIVYFATPIRSAIAKAAADRYLQSHYAQYELPPAEIVGVGYTEYYRFFKWVNGYSAQSYSSDHIAVIELNGWLPFLVADSHLFKVQDGENILIDPES